MTKIPQSHLLANRALLAVSGIFDSAGALTETISNDYGEDLLVQTQLDGEADPFRLVIQVKGIRTRDIASKSKSVRLKLSHLRRWVSHIEPVVLCIYDDRDKQVYAIVPKNRFSMWTLWSSSNRTQTVKISEKDIFNQATARSFIWETRIAHYSNMLSQFENRQSYVAVLEKSEEFRRISFQEGNIIVYSFLKSLGIIVGEEFNTDFTNSIKHGSRNISEDMKKTEDKRLNLRSVFTLALLKQVQDVAGGGLPTNLMQHGTEMCGVFFREYHQSVWQEAQQLFDGNNWNPYGRRKGLSSQLR